MTLLSLKRDYEATVEEFVKVEDELICFLKNAKGESLYAVFDLINAVYDPEDEKSVEAAAYAIEIDNLRYVLGDQRFRRRVKIHNKNEKLDFFNEHFGVISEATTTVEYQGDNKNERIANLISAYENEKNAYKIRFDVEYRPVSVELERLLDKLKDVAEKLYFAERRLIEHDKEAESADWIILGVLSMLVVAFVSIIFMK